MISWKEVLKTNFTKLKDLIAFLEISEDKASFLLNKPRFALNIPRRLAEKIKKNDLEDPIFLQFIPTIYESQTQEGFVLDPVGDEQARKEVKLLHKYQGRALLVTTRACAMNCRFCFRQNYDYQTEIKNFDNELKYISDDPSLKEIILSGGDPLSLNNNLLNQLFTKLNSIEHVERIRFHSRFIIGIPERVDEEFLKILSSSNKQIWFVIHCNHPNELDHDVAFALKKIQKLGIPVLNQAVLLKNINDSFEVQEKLCLSLSKHGIFPYYLHQLDKVRGAAHFEVNEQEGIQLIEKLKHNLSGYAVPKYVKEIAGELSKTAIL